MNVTKIRSHFPFLERKYQGKSLAFLDNASTTQKPKSVIDSLVDAYSNHYANIHRGVYDLSFEATELYENTRAQVRDLIGAESEKEVIFTRNATESINLLAYVQGESLTSGDEILLSEMEHHSNIVPWQMLKERASGKWRVESGKSKQIKIKYIPITQEGRLDFSSLESLVTSKTKIVSLTLMSNVLGTINPIKKIVSRIKNLSSKALIIVDAAQAAAHMKINVVDLDCDFLVFSAHKMYGPSGVGVLWGKRKILEQMPPFLGGGDMILAVGFEKATFNDLPWKFEAGTPNIADVIAFGEAITFINMVGFGKIKRYEMELTKYCVAKLTNDPTIQLFGPKNLVDRGPVISFNVDPSLRQAQGKLSSGQVPVHPHDVASILSEEGVAIRSGHHCAQPLMSVLGIDAVCRASFGIYNTKEEVDRLIAGIEKVERAFRLNPKHEIRNPKQFSKFKNSNYRKVLNL